MHRNLRRDPTPGGSPVVGGVQSLRSKVQSHGGAISAAFLLLSPPEEGGSPARPQAIASEPRRRGGAETQKRREGIESGRHESRTGNEGKSLKEKGEIGTPHPASRIVRPPNCQLPTPNSSARPHPASSIQHPASSIQHPASFIVQSPISHLLRPASKNTHGVERLRVPPRLHLPGQPPVIDQRRSTLIEWRSSVEPSSCASWVRALL